MIRKAVGEKRVRAHVARRGNAIGDADCLLPDWPRIGYFKNSGWGIKKLSQVGKINIRPHMISAEIVHRIQWRQIDLMRDSLPGFDLQGRLIVLGTHRRNWLGFASSYLKPKPRLPVGIVEVDVAPGQIGDAECRYDRFVSEVLQSLEFQVDLNLRFGFRGEKKKTCDRQNTPDQVAKRRNPNDAVG